jgi:hypothetical protein
MTVTPLTGVLFFFVIVGVFELQFAIAGLLVFAVAALAIYRPVAVKLGLTIPAVKTRHRRARQKVMGCLERSRKFDCRVTRRYNADAG